MDPQQMAPNGIYADRSMPVPAPGPAHPDSRVPTEVLQAAQGNSEGEVGLGEYLIKYHALQSPGDLSKEIQRIVHESKQIMRAAGIYRRGRTNFNLFYARESNSAWEENIREDGDQGGSMFISVNVLKNAVDHLMSMVTSHRPAIDPVVVNSSQEANDTTTIAKAIIDFRLHNQGEINTIDEGLRHCPILGASFLHGYWNPFKGEIIKNATALGKGQGVAYQVLPNGTPVTPLVFQGDLCTEVLSIFDVFYDLSAKSWDKDVNDCVVRVFRNKYDLMVAYPNMAAQIDAMPAKTTMMYDEYLPSPSFAATQIAKTPSQESMVEVWIYYHKRTAAVPYGRMQIQLPDGSVLDSSTLPEWVPFEGLPLFRMCPDSMINTPHGYAVTTSAGGLQEGLNIGASAMLTNMSAFARKLIIAQKGMEVEASNITGDLKLLEVEFGPNGQPPITSVDLMGNQSGLMDMLNWYVGQIEQDTGANSIVRGDPKGVTAGVAINLYQSMALQFASPYEATRSNAIAWMATSVVRAYQSYPNVQREVKIVGPSKIASLLKYYGSELTGIDSFTVDPGNPATRTLAMRYNMAVALKQDGVPIEPDKLVHLMKTGDWDSTVEGSDAINNNIRAENEKLLMGQPVHVIPGDDPVRHARGHLAVLSNQKVRESPELVKIVLNHYNEHLKQMSKGDIIMKLAAGMIPMGPFPPPTEKNAHGDTPPPSKAAAQVQAPQGAPGQGAAGQPQGHAPGAGSRMMGDGAKPNGVKPPPAPPVPGIPGVS